MNNQAAIAVDQNILLQLSEVLSCGTIDSSILDSAMEAMRKEKVMSIHPYAITPPSDAVPYWTTRVKKEGETRKKIKARTEKALLSKLYEFYFPTATPTLNEVFEMRSADRVKKGKSPATLKRDEQRWNKYIRDSRIGKKEISKITDGMIEDTFYDIIRANSVKRKEIKEIMSIVRGCFKFACKEKILLHNPVDLVEIDTTGCEPPATKNDHSRFYLDEEQEILIREAKRELEINPQNTTAIAILLEFKLATRIGELVALKYSDIDKENMTIHIQRMETKDEHSKPRIVEHLKKKSPYANRFLPITDEDLALIDLAMEIQKTYGYQDEDYIFVGEAGRIHIRAVDNRIRKLCKRGGIPEKSCHDIRRTVASTLYKKQVPIPVIRKFLGHSDEATTWKYIFDIDSEEKSNNSIRNALKMAEIELGTQGDPKNLKKKNLSIPVFSRD